MEKNMMKAKRKAKARKPVEKNSVQKKKNRPLRSFFGNMLAELSLDKDRQYAHSTARLALNLMSLSDVQLQIEIRLAGAGASNFLPAVWASLNEAG